MRNGKPLYGTLALITAGMVASFPEAQTISVRDSVSAFKTFQSVTGSVMTDPRWDQQTGQGADDFVGDGVGGYYGFYYNYGQVNGVDSLIFRFRFNLVEATGQQAPSFTGNARMGVDANGDARSTSTSA